MKLINVTQIGISLLILTDSCDLCMGMPLQPDMALPCQKDQKIRRHRCMFSPEEDQRLEELVKENGAKDWNAIAQQMPAGINAKQARDRWENYINYNPKPTFTENVDFFISENADPMRRKWKKMAALMHGMFGERFSPVAIRNRWRLLERRNRRQRMGIERTHRRLAAGIAASALTEPAPHETLEEALSERHLSSDFDDLFNDPYGPLSGLWH
ncbi:MAG: hypothetical protein LBQ26_01635 [Holosporales bacterium]|nr:hypothetical protein [Holosporales bacterium]